MIRSYVPNAPAVSSEVADGEAIIMHLRLGHYFSASSSGAFIWAGIERGTAVETIGDAVARHYRMPIAAAGAAVDDFLAVLDRHDLIRPGDAGGTMPDPAELGIDDVFVVPSLEVYTDMEDLLLLDPIHDVDTAGWPIAPAEMPS